jgi:hypothetical protein
VRCIIATSQPADDVDYFFPLQNGDPWAYYFTVEPGEKVWLRGSPNEEAQPQTVIINSSTSNDQVSAAGGTSLTTGTDKSGTITTGGTAQTLAASNASRKSLNGQNISSGDLWINETGGTAAVDTIGSFKISAGDYFQISTSNAISVLGATTGQKFSATEV